MKTALLFLSSLLLCAPLLPGAVYTQVSEKSPDGKFGMRITASEPFPEDVAIEPSYITAIDLVSLPGRKVLARLLPPNDAGTNISDTHLLWSPDSRRVAFSYQHPRAGYVHAFERSGPGFRKLEVPDIFLSDNLEGKVATFHVRREHLVPLSWLRSGALVMEVTGLVMVKADRDEDGESEDMDARYIIRFGANGRGEVIGRQDTPVFRVVPESLFERAPKGLPRSAAALPGYPDAFELGYTLRCPSPDGHLGLLVPDYSVLGLSAPASRNFIVATGPVRPLGLLEDEGVRLQGLAASWAEDSHAAVVTVQASPEPRAFYLLTFHAGELTQRRSLLPPMRALFEADYARSKAGRVRPRLPFQVLDDEQTEWRFEGDSLRVRCRASTNPELDEAEGTPVWWARLEAVWSLSQGRFTEHTVTRLFEGVAPNDQAMVEKKEEPSAKEDGAVETPAKEEAAPSVPLPALTILRAAGEKLFLRWVPKSLSLTLEQPGGSETLPLHSLAGKGDPKEPYVALPLAFLSPDERWLLIAGQEEQEVTLYPRQPGPAWAVAREQGVDLRARAGDFLRAELKVAQLEHPPEVSLVEWSPDGQELLLRLDAEIHGEQFEEPKEVRGWLCRYRAGEQRFSLTPALRAHNRYALENGNGRPDDWEADLPTLSAPEEQTTATRFRLADEKLNRAYQAALAARPAPGKEALRREQRSWLEQREREAATFATRSWSPWPAAALLEGRARATEERTRALEAPPSTP